MIAVDLFAGPGGWSLACQWNGITEHGVELDQAARDTRASAGFLTIHNDVETFVPDQEYDILIASPPCQTFSVAGKGAGRLALEIVTEAIHKRTLPSRDDLEAATGDRRTALVLEPLRYVLAHKPRYIMLEQVPTVLPVWNQYESRLLDMGYKVWTGLCHAEQFGVPQTRRRAILLAGDNVAPPVPTHSRYYPHAPNRLDMGVEPWVSMADALGWEGVVRSNYGTGGDPRNRGERQTDQPSATVTSKIDRNVRWPYQRPSTTIVGSFKPEIVAAPGYRTTVSRQNAAGSVRITVQEAGVLQSFPQDFPWQGSKNKQFQQVGNAIPPLLADALIKTLIKDKNE